jgi:zinc transport system permease protein
MRLYRSFLSVTICSAVLSVICTLAGMLLSILYGTPVGATIVAVDILAFLIFTAIGKAAGRE